MHFFDHLDQFSSESEEMRHYQVMTTLLESTHLALFHGLVPVLVALEATTPPRFRRRSTQPRRSPGWGTRSRSRAPKP